MSEAPKITERRYKLAEHARNVHHVTPEPGHTRAHLENPEYWAPLSRKFIPGDKVEVLAEDGSYYAELLVLACDRAWAKMHVLRWDVLTTTDVALSQADKFKVEHKGHVKKHCVIRVSDGAILFEGAHTKDVALKWLEDNRATITA